MKAVVIGGLGFIGSKIVNLLLAQGVEVTAADRTGSQELCDTLFGGNVQYFRCDICDPSTLGFFEGVDEVYNMAGVLGTEELESQVSHAVQVNIVGAVNVLEEASKNGVQRLFFPSKPNVWPNVYTITKEAVEGLARIYNKYHALRVCSLRVFNAYGPRQHLVPIRKIIPTFAVQAIRHLPIQIWGSGEQTVDLVHADDIARMSVDFTRKGSDQILDCGRGIAVTVNEVAEAVNAYFGSKSGLLHLPMRKGEIPETQLVADIQPLQELIGPCEFVDWESSLAETLDWYAALPAEEIDFALKFYKLI